MNIPDGKIVRVINELSYNYRRVGKIFKKGENKKYYVVFFDSKATIPIPFFEKSLEVLDDNLVPVVNSERYCNWCNIHIKFKSIKLNKKFKSIYYCPKCLR